MLLLETPFLQMLSYLLICKNWSCVLCEVWNTNFEIIHCCQLQILWTHSTVLLVDPQHIKYDWSAHISGGLCLPYVHHIWHVESDAAVCTCFLDILPSVAKWKTHLFVVLLVFFHSDYKQFSQRKLPSVNKENSSPKWAALNANVSLPWKHIGRVRLSSTYS